MTRIAKYLFSVVLSALLAVPASAISFNSEFSATITEVLDGDTVVVNISCLPIRMKLRLTGIDAPELKQEFGVEAKEKLASLVLNKQVVVVTEKQAFDGYGRLLGYLFITSDRKIFINREMVYSGMAVSETVAPNQDFAVQLNIAEQQAKKEKRGFWKQGGLKIRPKYFREHKGVLPETGDVEFDTKNLL
jgi:micrococcal nuclease